MRRRARVPAQDISRTRRAIPTAYIEQFQYRRIRACKRLVQRVLISGEATRTMRDTRSRTEGNLRERMETHRRNKRVWSCENSDHGYLSRHVHLDPVQSVATEHGTGGSVAMRIMSNMGYVKCTEPIIESPGSFHGRIPVWKTDRAGVGAHTYFEDMDYGTRLVRDECADTTAVQSRDTSLCVLHVVCGRRIRDIIFSPFCDARLLTDALELRSRIHVRGTDSVNVRRFFCCYKIPLHGFVSRVALALADIDMYTEARVNHAQNDSVHSKGRLVLGALYEPAQMAPTTGAAFDWVDLYGGRGGMSDYISWAMQRKEHPRALRGAIVHRLHKMAPMTDRFKSDIGGPIRVEIVDIRQKPVDCESLEDILALVGCMGSSVGRVSLILCDGISGRWRHKNHRSLELQSIRALICSCVAALKLLRVGGTFVCRVGDTFGRVTAGCFTILMGLFSDVRIVRPRTVCPAKPDRFIVCRSFKGYMDGRVRDCTSHLIDVLTKMRDIQAKPVAVLEIIYTPCLVNNETFNYIRSTTIYHLRMEYLAMSAFVKWRNAGALETHGKSEDIVQFADRFDLD